MVLSILSNSSLNEMESYAKDKFHEIKNLKLKRNNYSEYNPAFNSSNTGIAAKLKGIS